MPEGADYYVTPGDDDTMAIQTAFVSAQDGETVWLGPGTFHIEGALSVSNLANFTLRGDSAETTILDFSGQTTGSDAILMMNMTDVTVSDLSIVDPPGDGLVIEASDGVTIQRTSIGWSEEARSDAGKYAIYPVASSNVLIEDSEAYGASDAAFYVGQVTNCIVRNNTAFDNVAAYEIENSTNCEMTDNVAENNVGGMLVFELPGLPVMGGGTLVANNTVVSNNLDNWAEAGTIVGLVPRGTGLMVIAANDVEVTGNTIDMNEGMAIGLISWGTATMLGGGEEPPPTYDPWLDGIYIHDNTIGVNGTMPGGDGSNENDPLWQVRALLGGAGVDISMGVEDILWDGLLDTGASPDVICIQESDASYRDLDLAGSAAMTSTDVSVHDCTGTPRPPVQLE